MPHRMPHNIHTTTYTGRCAQTQQSLVKNCAHPFVFVVNNVYNACIAMYVFVKTTTHERTHVMEYVMMYVCVKKTENTHMHSRKQLMHTLSTRVGNDGGGGGNTHMHTHAPWGTHICKNTNTHTHSLFFFLKHIRCYMYPVVSCYTRHTGTTIALCTVVFLMHTHTHALPASPHTKAHTPRSDDDDVDNHSMHSMHIHAQIMQHA